MFDYYEKQFVAEALYDVQIYIHWHFAISVCGPRNMNSDKV